MDEKLTLEQILEEHLGKYASKISAKDWQYLQLALYHYAEDAYNRGWTDCQDIGEGKRDKPAE